MLPIAFGKGTRAQERESTNGISRAERKGVFEASGVRPAFISRLYLEVSLSPWPEQPHPPPWGGGHSMSQSPPLFEAGTRTGSRVCLEYMFFIRAV